MVCANDGSFTVCYVTDAAKSNKSKCCIHVPKSCKVSELFQEVCKEMSLEPDSFELILINDKNGNTVLKNKADTIGMAGLKLDGGNELLVRVLPEDCSFKIEEYSASEADSPTIAGDYATPVGPPPPPPPLPASTSSSGDYNHSGPVIRPEIGYVGLVNQAMTCYLNSLLQALFMTPEFRNALYNWEFDGYKSDEAKSIPYQLQKLFLNLQTSHKTAVETTELTRSFGWDSSEAWQQHDIQELCRVMFDTLEQKFKNTEQSDLIKRLYEGKMIDYVKCLDCSIEKCREDTFLDIPLPLRRFNSNIAYGSVEEALRAFVQPETLDGNNQYHCETCNKKCDAHKGLKFSKFPYLLTLHLKRFDFDYSTLHRIKLNDKVTFPEKLNLNSFIDNSTRGEEVSETTTPEETAVKCNDSTTTDNGSALDDEGCQNANSVTVSNSQDYHNAEYQEDDDDIDMYQNNENEKNKHNAMQSGPYVYELYSIMIHSGSAAGGHYYAYIKDFKDGEWYCFNDQLVTRITYEDVKKTYGGGAHRGYYSGVYSSSTNAYMLMYRQIDSERNASAMTVEEFPPHIKALHKKLEEQKERENRLMEGGLRCFQLYYYHPETNGICRALQCVSEGQTLRESVDLARKTFMLEKIPLERCRLVKYDRAKKSIECSFEGKEDMPVSELFPNYKDEFLLEVRKEGEEFEVISQGSIRTKVHLVHLDTEEVKGPVIVRGNLNETVGEYKETVAKHLKLPAESLLIMVQKFSNELKLLSRDSATLKNEDFDGNIKIYVVSFAEEQEIKMPQVLSKLREIIDVFVNIITLHISLPNVDNEILEKLNIPPLEQRQPQSQSQCNTLNSKQTDELLLTGQSRGASPNDRDSSPQPLPDPEDECMGPAEPHSDQSASEDSSLTDSERTIVGEAPGDCLAQLSPSNSSVGSDQNVSSPENEGNDYDLKPELYGCRKFKNCFSNFSNNEMGVCWYADDQESTDLSKGYNSYFKASPYVDNKTSQKMLKVCVDKRMTQRTLQQCLEPFVGVSADHFKICSADNVNSDDEFLRPTDSPKKFRDGDNLIVKLGRVLRKGECLGKVYYIDQNIIEPDNFLLEWVIANGANVGQVKKEIIEEVRKKCAIEIEYSRCRLRKKSGKNPSHPYLDDSTFENLSNHWEMFLQELPGEEPVKNANQTLLFVKQWNPSKFMLFIKPFHEIVLDTKDIKECKEKISQLSGIPEEFVEIAKARGPFSYIDESTVTFHSDLEWESSAGQLDRWPLHISGDGQVIFYRDSREKGEHLNNFEKVSIITRNTRLIDPPSRSIYSYSSMKERALKIHLDNTPPRRRKEADVD